jgi:hypothetical protein
MTMPLRAWRHLALCVPLVLLGACASSDKPKLPVAPAVVEAPGKAAVTVTGASDGARVVVAQVQELRVELPNSAWSIAQNFEWSVVDLGPGVLTPTGSRFERTARDVNPLESDGTTVFRFRPQAAGAVTLKFALRRPHRLDAPLQTVSFDVIVK